MALSFLLNVYMLCIEIQFRFLRFLVLRKTSDYSPDVTNTITKLYNIRQLSNYH